ncbi:MAG: folate family ECF transporter S component [Oscillospiraceae bacterium]|nr:folate family ECF transporter S component [Oscillospiraceae bacterium]
MSNQLFKNRRFTTATICTLAMLTALNVVLDRLVAFNAGPYRVGIGTLPLLLSGLLFGPIPGAIVGFTGDLIGALTLGNAPYNPLFCVTPILMGVLPGLLRQLAWRNQKNPIGIAAACLPPYLFGSLVYTTVILSKLGYAPPLFTAAFWPVAAARALTYLITYGICTAIIYLLIQSRVFNVLGIVPKVKGKANSN